MTTLYSATMPQGKRLNIYFTDDDDLKLYEEIEAIAKDEKRSMSQMVKLLVIRAIAERQGQVKEKNK
ncbi:hypothetical protein WA1_04225 [Scytonema hofmannii PCC 7110]|uniref:CopG-like ribbon-helix-helix domain-containing protein n=1 Tax=Scytonema hofmannii PCC 7110 TaxID=128403 RepID=A0A139WZD3_9CYAN|nr:hypothetical protein [Scytonema hofmannii]KYC37732.1 hypothetical protein WA1_04225 [Scytonema hofmannii PCC 7110]